MIFDIVSLRSLSFQVNNSEIFFILNTYSGNKVLALRKFFLQLNIVNYGKI